MSTPGDVLESSLHVPTREGPAPLLLHCQAGLERFRGTVLIIPGFCAHKEVQRAEAHALARAGLLAVTLDAVGHGERRWPDLHPGHLLEVVTRTAAELPEVLDALTALLGPRAGRFGLTGISMGGFITFAAAAVEPRLAAFAPVLASPDWTPLAGGNPEWLARSPHRHPGAVGERALLALNAGRDELVPLAPARAFVEALRAAHPSASERHAFVAYPHSAHAMREEDWIDLWPRVVAWMSRHLGG